TVAGKASVSMTSTVKQSGLRIENVKAGVIKKMSVTGAKMQIESAASEFNFSSSTKDIVIADYDVPAVLSAVLGTSPRQGMTRILS
ncbi:hypothetical protein AAEJ42_22915, partial [Shewanella algae]|uniref:hypothetical protein n=1 Tax=Shewanella algae TaxID=38313 RepID=UPI00313B2532